MFVANKKEDLKLIIKHLKPKGKNLAFNTTVQYPVTVTAQSVVKLFDIDKLIQLEENVLDDCLQLHLKAYQLDNDCILLDCNFVRWHRIENAHTLGYKCFVCDVNTPFNGFILWGDSPYQDLMNECVCDKHVFTTNKSELESWYNGEYK